jgi:hypothetical protein
MQVQATEAAAQQPLQQPKTEVDAYTQQMLGAQASYGGSGMYKQEQPDIKFEEPAAKRVKTEAGEEPAGVDGGAAVASGDGGDEEWEEI